MTEEDYGDMLDKGVSALRSMEAKVNEIISLMFADMDALLAVIMHPVFGKGIIYDRIGRILSKGKVILEQEAGELRRKIYESAAPEEIEKSIQQFLFSVRLVNMAVREAIARLLII